MPGGQVTNLRAQARSMGLENRWPEIAETYAAVNRAFGEPELQLHERHAASDFETRTQDKLNAAE